MPSATFDWKSLVEMGAAKIVDGLQGQNVREVERAQITPALAEALKGFGVDPERRITVRWQTPPPRQDAYVFEQDDA